MIAVAVLMTVWWVSEAIPLFATALLPMVLYPLLGIMKSSATAPVYVNSIIFLFIGGFMIALSMEKWQLHKRIALFIISRIKGGPDKLVLGFMLASAFLSMWISNTATAIMMVPIGLSIILKMEEEFGIVETQVLSRALMLGIAYACSLGGIATLVGTPPNLSLVQIFNISFPKAEAISFGYWMLMSLPITGILLCCAWLILTRVLFPIPKHLIIDSKLVDKEYKALGVMRFEEKAVMLIFSMTALLWIFRKPLDLGVLVIPGWSNLLPQPVLIDDASIALFMALLLFIIPTRSLDAKSHALLDVHVVKKLPWDIVLLFGGGFALAKGFQVSGLSTFIGEQFGGLAGTSPLLMVMAISFGMTFLTELTSNTATTEMILPILAAIAVATKNNPLLLMIPATLSASCAFMFPVATAPNAIVFGSGRIQIYSMIKAGLLLNIIGVVVISLIFFFIGTDVFAINSSSFPEWAQIQE